MRIRTVRWKSFLRNHPRRGYAISLAGVLLAVGAIVLLRAPAGSASTGPFEGGDGPTFQENGPTRASFNGPMLSGRFALSQGAVLANGPRRLLAELRLEAADDAAGPAVRTPVAIAIVIDTSGSMAGDKIVQARDSVLAVVERMHDDDRVAIVTYNHEATVLQPLARVGDVRFQIRQLASTIIASGGTNIPAGLQLGASAIAMAPDSHVHRTVLVSDGRDHSGLGVDGVAMQVRRQAQSGLTLSALGIGLDYDEHFMVSVADAGNGNYEFMQDGSRLSSFLAREFDQARATVVEGVVAEMRLPAGIRLDQVYGAEVPGGAGTVTIPLGAMHAGSTRKVVLNLVVDAGSEGDVGEIEVDVRYRTVRDREDHEVEGGALAVRVVETDAEVLASQDSAVLADATSTAVDAKQTEAIQAWRTGDVARARDIASQNLTLLRGAQSAAPSPARAAQIQEFERDEATFDSVPAGSAEGAAYGLGSNSERRQRIMH